MQRLLKFVARLYPGWWRTRYGDELRALLEDTDPRWTDLADLCKGAIQMQLTRAGIAACAAAGTLLAVAAFWAMPARYVSTAGFASPDAIPTKVIDEQLANVKHKVSSFPTHRKEHPGSMALITFFSRDRAASEQVLHDVFSALKAHSIPINEMFVTQPEPVGSALPWLFGWGLAAGLLAGLIAARIHRSSHHSPVRH